MPKTFGLMFGALSDDIEVQLRRQGLTLGDRAEMVQRWVDALCDLGINEIITEGDRDRARNRLMKRIPPMVQVFTEPPTDAQ